MGKQVVIASQRLSTPERTGHDGNLPGNWITGPTLRKKLNISAPTLWRWRRFDFPIPKIINGRLYFRIDQVEAWMAAQRDAV